MSESANTPARSWLKPFLKPFVPVFREVVAMSFFVNLLALAVPVFTMQVYNRVVANAGISTLQGLIVGMILVLIFDYILRQSRARILQTVALRVDVKLGRQLFRKLMRLPMQDLESQPSAHWSSLFRDVDMVRNTLSGSSALLIADLPFALLFLVLIFIIAAPVAWVLLVMLPVFMFVAWRSSNVMADASGEERQSSQSRDSLIAEMIAGRTTIKALALDRSMEPVWADKHAHNIENAISRGSKTDGFSNLGASLSLITSLLLTTVGALAIIDQNLTIGALIATNMLSGRIMGPLNQLVGMWRTYSSFLQATDRLGRVFESNADRTESEVKLDKPKGKLSIQDVVFAYGPDMAPVVSNISVDIDPGGIHALVGRNGSGKTTLLKLIQGLYQPQTGRVMMDDADIAQFTRSELADWLGYVPQESVLFAGTVRDNIASRMPDASDEDIIKASTEAGVHHFIIDLPDGYATEIGEAGSRLSGGQRQRIAIARALVGDPPVVLLDEPSSSLDRHAEHELKNTLVEIAKTRTVIIVSHSPTLLSACDYLYALDRGKLALAGPAREILPRLFGGKAPPPKDDEKNKKETAAKSGAAKIVVKAVPKIVPKTKAKDILQNAALKTAKVTTNDTPTQHVPLTPPPTTRQPTRTVTASIGAPTKAKTKARIPTTSPPTTVTVANSDAPPPKKSGAAVIAKIGPARSKTRARTTEKRVKKSPSALTAVITKISAPRPSQKQTSAPTTKANLTAQLRSVKPSNISIPDMSKPGLLQPQQDNLDINTAATPILRQVPKKGSAKKRASKMKKIPSSLPPQPLKVGATLRRPQKAK